jgi:hypothetical protein
VTGTTTVIITGTNFIPTSGTQVTVNFGPNVTVCQVAASGSSVTCAAPKAAAAGQVDVQVTAAGGQSAINKPGDLYTYTP